MHQQLAWSILTQNKLKLGLQLILLRPDKHFDLRNTTISCCPTLHPSFPAHARDQRGLEHERQRAAQPEWLLLVLGITSSARPKVSRQVTYKKVKIKIKLIKETGKL